jgi:hypothetical protein
MKLPRYTLVHRKRAPRGAQGAAQPAGFVTGGAGMRLPGAPAPAQRVGIWDLGAYVGRLPAVIDVLNASQRDLVFYEAIAALPAGTVSRPERVRAWSQERTGSRRLPGVEDNVIAEDFFRRATVVRRDLGLDYLAGITSRLVADEDEGEIYWNLFSTCRGKLVLVSSSGLREYAQQAGRPFEYAVAGVILAQLMAALHPRLAFHQETRGCLFDYHEDRSGIVQVLKDPRIDEECLARMTPKVRTMATAMVEALRQYAKGGGS